MKMNFNPFTSKPISHIFKRSGKHDMFDRTVGRPKQMGIFDYALVLPALVKTGMALTEKRSKVAYGLFAALSVPLAITKFGLYIGTGPLIFIAWLIKKIAKKNRNDHKVSRYTNELSQIIVKPASDNNKDLDQNVPVNLSEVVTLRDGNLKYFSIKANDADQLVLTTFPRNKLVATFEPTRSNILRMMRLNEGAQLNRVKYFMSNAGKNIFDFSAIELINKINAAQTKDRVKRMYEFLVNSKVEDEANRDNSFAKFPRDIRDLIAKQVMLAAGPDNEYNRFFLRSFEPKQCEQALQEFIRAPKPKN
ncbi:MAG TPA: hypothetical protein VL360_01145 [Gammaproteobacteria bacterium]|jgi:hypothetical protein|nr:hypothetical protein [Gammaproteobacteria bacterium]